MLDILNLFFGNAADIPGHIGFLLMAVSLFLTSIVWLRIFLIASFALQIVYFALQPTPLFAGMAWSVLFIAINLYRLKSLHAARAVVDAARGGDLLRESLGELDDEELARIITFGELLDFAPGAVVLAEGQSIGALLLVASGKASAEVGGARVGTIGKRAFIGEIPFLTGAPSGASIRALTPLRLIALDSAQLKAAGAEDPRLAAGLYRALGASLAEKLAAVVPARQAAS